MKNAMIKTALLLMLYFCVQLSFSQQTLEYVYTNQLGGDDDEEILSLETDSEGNTWALLGLHSDMLYLNQKIIGTSSFPYLMKFNPGGELLFSYTFTPLEESNMYTLQIKINSDDEVLCTGILNGSLEFGDTTISTAVGNGFICKFLPDGTPEAIKLISISNHGSYARDFNIDQDNNIYLAGISLDSIYFDQNNDTIFAPSGIFKMPVWKLDDNFNLQWIKVFSSNNTIIGDHSVQFGSGQNIFMASYVGGDTLHINDQTIILNETWSHIIMLRLSTSGEIIWLKSADGGISSETYTICSDEENNLYLTGSFYTSFTYDTLTFTHTGLQANEAFVMSIDKDGNFRWYTKMQCILNLLYHVYPNEMKLSDGSLYLSGQYQSDAYFGDLPISRVSGFYYYYDTYLSRIDKQTGLFQWAQGFYGNISGWIRKGPISFGSFGNIYFSSQFSGEATFGNVSLQSYGGKDVFISKLNETFVGVNDAMAGSSVVVFPNPGSAKLSIQITENNVSFKLYNQNGQLVMSKKLHQSGTQSFNTSSLPGGLYFYQLTDRDGYQETGKWIKR